MGFGHAKPYYDAEFEIRFMLEHAYEARTVHAYGSTVVLPDERKFGRVENVNEYLWKVAELLDLGEPPLAVYKQGRKDAHYNALQRTIHLPPHLGSHHSWAMREIVVLHEYAHHLSREERESHGPIFCGAFVFLVEHCIGPEVAFLLRCAFAERGCAVTPWKSS